MEWVDDFEGSAGSSPGPWWVPEQGHGRWGDPRQLQWYTGRRENAALDGAGRLVLTARREPAALPGVAPAGAITSARLTTLGRLHLRYGSVEARIRVPGGLGTWPAFWMLGTDMADVGWPACGEIDVMEHVGSLPSTVHGTVHLPGRAGLDLPDSPPAGIGTAHDAGVDLSEAFHDYAVQWEPDRITWMLDGHPYASIRREQVPGAGWPFDHDMYLLLNLAVGGSWPGNETDDPPLPARLLVERVRVVSDHLDLGHGRG